MPLITKPTKLSLNLGLRIPRALGSQLGLGPGDGVALKVEGSRLVVGRVDPDYQEALRLGQQCSARYGQALARLAG